MSRRTFRSRGFLFGFCFSLLASAALAQEYPTKAIRTLIPYPAGSGPDIMARVIGQQMAGTLGQPFVIDNKGGGGGVPAILELKNAAPDGYTVLELDSSQWAMYPALRPNAPYDAARDFAPVGLIYTAPVFIYTRADSPYKDLRELVAAARAKPGKMQYGVTGLGGLMHVVGEAFKNSGNLDVLPIAYQASQQSLAGVVSGDLDYAIAGYGSLLPQIQAGKVRALAASTNTRNKDAPDVPTIAEALGVPTFNFAVQYGMVGHSGTPKPVLDKLAAALAKALAQPDVAQRAKALSLDLTPLTPEQFSELIRSDIAKYSQTVKAARLKLE